MAKVINTRSASMYCLLLVAGILLTLGFYYHYTVLCAVAVSVIVTILALCAILYRSYIRSAFGLVFFVVGIVAVLLYIYCGAVVLYEQNTELDGTVIDINYYEYSVQLVLDDVNYTTLDEYGNYTSGQDSLSGYTLVYVYYTDPQLNNIDYGSRVYLRGTVNNLYVLQDEIVTYYYKYNYNYAVTSANVYSVLEGSASLSQIVDNYVLDRLVTYMPYNYGTAYAMLLGDKSYMDAEQYSSYQDIGIAHLFAISGMHIGILVSSLVFVLTLAKVNKKYHIYIVMPPLLIYGYLCGFSPSIARAIIMTLVVLLARTMHSGTDLISSMSVAMILILIVRPLYLFDVSFILSFSSVFGIATIGYALMRAVKYRTNNRAILAIVNVAILSFAVTTTSVFLVAQYFGTVSVVGVLVNMILVPLLPFLFIACLVGMIPQLSFVLVYTDSVLSYMASIATVISSMSFATVVLPTIGIAVLVWFVLLFVLGGYVNVRGICRGIVVSTLCVALVALSLVNILPQSTSDSIMILDTNNIVVVITDSDSDIIHVVSTLDDEDDMLVLTEVLSHIKYNQMYVYCTDVMSVILDNMLVLYDDYNLTKLYYFDAYSGQQIQGYGVDILRIDKGGYTNNSVVVGSIYSGGIIGLDITTNFCRIAVLDTSYYYALFGIDDSSGYHCVFCTSDSTMLQSSLQTTPLLVTKQLCQSNIYGQNMYGNFTIEPKGDTITINRGIVP